MSPPPTRLPPYFREIIWGVTRLEPWFANTEKRIGEVWFWPQDQSILAKFIFTSDRLSIQVHPSDAQAARLEGASGKTEMWYILRAEPGARIALGLREPVSRERLRQAAQSAEIENLLNWIPVQPGESYSIYPGTIHTIGPGVTLCEIQQYSDLTYRLYDYGRPRPLHLDKAVEVAELAPHPGRINPVRVGEGRWRLASCPHFTVEQWDLTGATPCQPETHGTQVLMVLEGQGSLQGESFRPGEVWLIPAGREKFVIQPERSAHLLRACVPGSAAC
jgi:mannose-6-phosphate isomerase